MTSGGQGATTATLPSASCVNDSVGRRETRHSYFMGQYAQSRRVVRTRLSGAMVTVADRLTATAVLVPASMRPLRGAEACDSGVRIIAARKIVGITARTVGPFVPGYF